ncbi:MAG: OmpA family protein [Candidatus Thiodiazotropha sp.]
MQLKKISLVLALVPMAFSTAVLAEKGVAYDATKMGWRTSYGECWTTNYRDADPAPTGCFGEPEGDADGDGVLDSKDQCPGTPAGAKVDANGCELDSDGDGVVDSKDQCPGTPAGAKVDAKGCELDSDGDGVVDSKDQCPNTPAGATVDARGCAVGLVLQNVQFQTNSNVLTADSKAVLDKVADSIKARGDITSLTVIGHTDSMGAAEYNQSLSERRAKAVADYLASQGVDAGILSSKGMGESAPIADNGTAAGRAQNRRVELRVN